MDRRPDGALDVTYLAMVSLVDEQGQVTFEPSCTVRDVLVWSQEGAGGGRWRTRSRFLRHDTSDMSRVWEGRLTGRT